MSWRKHTGIDFAAEDWSGIVVTGNWLYDFMTWAQREYAGMRRSRRNFQETVH